MSRQPPNRRDQRRPGVDAEAAAAGADRIMALLQAGSDELLGELSFDEAREVLARQQQDLTGIVRQELDDYRLARADRQPDAPEVPWSRYEREADALRRPDDRRAAAGELLGFDDVEGRQVFQRATRKKLERMLKDRVIRATDPSCPELGLLRAARALEGGLKRVQLVRSPEASPGYRNLINAARGSAGWAGHEAWKQPAIREDAEMNMQLLGHARLETTRVYTRPTAEDRSKAVDLLPVDE